MSVVNHSTARQKFSFPKSPRFYQIKPRQDVCFSTCVPTMFNSTARQVKSGFGGSARWEPKREKLDWPCKDINLQPSHFRSPGKFSFGTSRTVMQKLHVDRVFSDAEKGNMAPSPDTYDIQRSSFLTISPRTPKLAGGRHNLKK